MVLPAPESEESAVARQAGLPETGESGVVGLDGSGEPGVCIYPVIPTGGAGEGEGMSRWSCVCVDDSDILYPFVSHQDSVNI